MSIIGEDFYPTPNTVIDKMLEGFKTEDLLARTILEPSAGNGNIVDRIKDRLVGSYHSKPPDNIYCVESNVELRMVLTGKGYKVIGDDFLKYKSNYLFDLIVMNPPFRDGATHLLKAWEILNGGDVVCLLNAETVTNPHTREQQLLREIIDANGGYEVMGACFKTAERKTDVEVALVRLHKKEPEIKFDFFEQKTREQEINFEEFKGDNLPALKDTFGNLEIMYDNAREACADVLRSRSRLEFYLDHLTGDGDVGKVQEEKTFNGMIDVLKAKAWDYLFSRTKLAEVMTQRVQTEFDAFQKQSRSMDFTRENICNLLETLFLNRGEIMKQCVLDAFDQLTRYDKKNAVHVEGWKTNDAWRVNRTVIVPWGCETDWNGKPRIHYNRERDFADIEKALSFIVGEKFAGYKTSIGQTISGGGVAWGTWNDSRFFRFKMFKKGTIHLYFKDEWVLQEFNVRAARFKNWLPDDYNEREARANKDRGVAVGCAS
jgi:hypothetical protein